MALAGQCGAVALIPGTAVAKAFNSDVRSRVDSADALELRKRVGAQVFVTESALCGFQTPLREEFLFGPSDPIHHLLNS